VTVRRGILLVAVVLSMAVLVVLVSRRGSESRSGTRIAESSLPNVVVIVTDDQRAGGGSMAAMPKTRAWFKRGGVAFPNAFVSIPLCCPSRSTIFTGQYAHNHGVEVNGPMSAKQLDPEATVQRYLQDAGYRTAIFGKYLNGWTADPPHFDEWATHQGPERRYFGGEWNVNGAQTKIARYSTDYIRHKAVSFLRRANADDERPWFLYVAPSAPHFPYVPSEKYAHARVPPWKSDPAVFERDRSDKPLYVRKRTPSTFAADLRTRRRQLRTQYSLDDLVARLSVAIGKLGESRRTLAFFVSDNGYAWGEHGLLGTDLSKSTPYTESITVPMFARWPGSLPTGLIDRRLVSTVDIAPTILQAAGIRPDGEYPVDGRSLLQRSWTRRETLTEHWHVLEVPGQHPTVPEDAPGPEWATIRTRSYQYIEDYAANGAVSFREYYDLRRDPWQLRNLLGDGIAANNPDIVALHERLAHDRRCVGTTGPEACP
jgi:arylsulfatase A-like enzyme